MEMGVQNVQNLQLLQDLIQIIGKLHQNRHLKAEILQVLKEWRKGIMAERLSKLLLKMSS